MLYLDKNGLEYFFEQINARLLALEGEVFSSTEEGSDNILVGTYVGDGSFSRVIDLGVTPKFGMLYSAQHSLYEIIWELYAYYCRVAFFGELGASQPIEVGTDNTITVYSQATIADNGATYRFNESDITYVYVVWY